MTQDTPLPELGDPPESPWGQAGEQDRGLESSAAFWDTRIWTTEISDKYICWCIGHIDMRQNIFCSLTLFISASPSMAQVSGLAPGTAWLTWIWLFRGSLIITSIGLFLKYDAYYVTLAMITVGEFTSVYSGSHGENSDTLHSLPPSGEKILLKFRLFSSAFFLNCDDEFLDLITFFLKLLL